MGRLNFILERILLRHCADLDDLRSFLQALGLLWFCSFHLCWHLENWSFIKRVIQLSELRCWPQAHRLHQQLQGMKLWKASFKAHPFQGLHVDNLTYSDLHGDINKPQETSHKKSSGCPHSCFQSRLHICETNGEMWIRNAYQCKELCFILLGMTVTFGYIKKCP